MGDFMMGLAAIFVVSAIALFVAGLIVPRASSNDEEQSDGQ